MAKSKKRKYEKKKRKIESPAPAAKAIVNAEPARLEPIPAHLFMVMPYMSNFEPINNGEIAPSLALDAIYNYDSFGPEAIGKLEKRLAAVLEPMLRKAVLSSSLDPALNAQIDGEERTRGICGRLYNKNMLDARRSFIEGHDAFDFSGYKSNEPSGDVFLDAINRVAETDDPAYLWSTSDKISIKINNQTEYQITRGKYDKEYRSVEYTIAAFEKTYLIEGHLMTVPSLVVKGRAGIMTVSEIETTLALLLDRLEREKIDIWTKSGSGVNLEYAMIEASHSIVSNFKRSVGREQKKTNPDWEPDWTAIYMPVLETDEMLYAAHISAWCREQIKNSNAVSDADAIAIARIFGDNSSPEIRGAAMAITRKLVSLSVSNLMLGLYRDADNFSEVIDENGEITKGSPEQSLKIAAYMLQKTMMPLACVIAANGLIMDKKLSRPVPASKSRVKAEAARNGRAPKNESVGRKIRVLDNKIKISSLRKPEAPTAEKIIRYSMSEWGRAGHLRHYKNGKIIEIKPMTVRRRCVGATENSPGNAKGTDYIVRNKPDNSK